MGMLYNLITESENERYARLEQEAHQRYYEKMENERIRKFEEDRYDLIASGNYDNTDAYETSCNNETDYGPSNPWDAPGMSISDFCDFPVVY